MAEIQANVLEKLKCGECECYLSCSPVYLKTDGGSVCGRCPLPEQQNGEVIRNSPYEELATLVVFPCRYQQHGCHKKLPISEVKQHEDTCEFHPLICPVAPSGSCEWVDIRQQLLDHCKAKHPQQVLQNPSTLKHDITINSLNTYLMSVFQVLFLIHTKVCLTTKKIYYSVRLLGDSEHVFKYSYGVDIENNGTQLKKQGVVAEQGCLALQEDSALAIGINSLLGVLGGFDDTTFKITLSALLEQCVKCGKEEPEIMYRDVCGGQCAACAPAMVPCGNRGRGCAYTDIPLKVGKHQGYHCRYSTKCEICGRSVSVDVGLEEHYRSRHSDVTHGTTDTWTTTLNARGQWHIVTCDVGVLVCTYWLSPSQFSLHVYSPLRNAVLCGYSCEVWLSHPGTGRSVHRTLDVQYNTLNDWYTSIPRGDISQVLANNQCDMKVEWKKNVLAP